MYPGSRTSQTEGTPPDAGAGGAQQVSTRRAGVSLPDRVLDVPRPETESESHSVMSDSLRPHGLYSPWNSPGQNTGVGRPPSPVDLPNLAIEPRFPALQADSLPSKPPGKTIPHPDLGE